MEMQILGSLLLHLNLQIRICFFIRSSRWFVEQAALWSRTLLGWTVAGPQPHSPSHWDLMPQLEKEETAQASCQLRRPVPGHRMHPVCTMWKAKTVGLGLVPRRGWKWIPNPCHCEDSVWLEITSRSQRAEGYSSAVSVWLSRELFCCEFWPSHTVGL